MFISNDITKWSLLLHQTSGSACSQTDKIVWNSLQSRNAISLQHNVWWPKKADAITIERKNSLALCNYHKATIKEQKYSMCNLQPWLDVIAAWVEHIK